MTELQTDTDPLTIESDLAPPSIKAIMWEHVLENVPAAVEELRTSDIIAIEYVGLPDEEARLEYGHQATIYLSSKAPEEERAKAAEYLDTNNDRLLFESLQGTDKRVVAIDIGTDHQDFRLVSESNAAKATFDTSFRGNEQSQTLINNLDDYITKSAISHEAREHLIISQIRDLAAEPESQGKEIAVLLGALHTPVQHALAKEYRTSRVFISDDPKHNGIEYHPIIQLARERRFFPERELPREKLARVVLALTVEDVIETDEDLKLLHSMTDEEVSEMLAAIDEKKHFKA